MISASRSTSAPVDKMFRIPVPRPRMKTHPLDDRVHQHGHVVPTRVNQSLASPFYTPAARSGTRWQMKRSETATRLTVASIQVTSAVKFKVRVELFYFTI